MIMISDEHRQQLISFIADLKEEDALNQVQVLLDGGETPLAVFDLCYKGLNEVGQRYQKEIYALSGLIMAGDIMRRIGLILLPLLEGNAGRSNAGRIILATVEGDIHFIGKDIFKTMVQGHGFAVHDLGVDVPPAKFLSAIHEYKPDIVGLSCLISAAYPAMAETIHFLRQHVPQALSPRAYIIGGRIDRYVFETIDADYWTNDAIEGVALCERIMAPPHPDN